MIIRITTTGHFTPQPLILRDSFVTLLAHSLQLLAHPLQLLARLLPCLSERLLPRLGANAVLIGPFRRYLLLALLSHTGGLVETKSYRGVAAGA